MSGALALGSPPTVSTASAVWLTIDWQRASTVMAEMDREDARKAARRKKEAADE